jgi:hypothetical protein
MNRCASDGAIVKFGAVLAFALAAAACGSGGGRTDGGLPFGDAGTRTDGGARTDGGVDGGVRADGGTSGGDGGTCTTTSQCFLAQKCESGQCQADPGGIGADCPNGDECNANTACTGMLPNASAVCTADCATNSDCPRTFTCQSISISFDGGVEEIKICLAPDALGVACRNFTATGDIDPTRQCTQQGFFCNPDGPDSNTGNCVEGDNCNFKAQTGCTGSQTCHPLGVFGIDNNQGTLCFDAASSGGQQGASCADIENCAKGFVCVPISDTESICLKYCTPNDATHNCAGLTGMGGGPDGGTTAAECLDLLSDGMTPAPASINSIPAGVCF